MSLTNQMIVIAHDSGSTTQQELKMVPEVELVLELQWCSLEELFSKVQELYCTYTQKSTTVMVKLIEMHSD